jgi:hypothetical protein
MGAFRVFRRVADSGRWNDAHFCPECGVCVFIRMEAFADAIGVPVGCFGDPAFGKPATLYWSTRRHHWLAPPDFEIIETQ